MKVVTRIEQGGARATKTSWYAPGIGLVRQATDSSGVTSTTDLIDYSFRPGGETAGRRALCRLARSSVGIDPEKLEAVFARAAREVSEGLLPSARSRWRVVAASPACAASGA